MIKEKVLSLDSIEKSYALLKNVVKLTPLEKSYRLSKKYDANIYLKREDLQTVRSYKIRGAYSLISSLNEAQKEKGVVCASAGNHAQGVAVSCKMLGVKGVIFMPLNTPRQKIQRTKSFGGKWIEVKLVGDSFDIANEEALNFCKKNDKEFVHPFDDIRIIEGQATVGLEILEQLGKFPDYVIGPVGGGGLMSGVGYYIKNKESKTTLFGAEPQGAPSMIEAIKKQKPVTLPSVDTFVDGAAVKTAGEYTWKLCSEFLDDIFLIPEGKVCTEMIDLYQNDGIIAEPAGALSVSALDILAGKIKGKIVVCIISGGNNDITRYAEIIERSLIYKGLKHYFIVDFPQRPGSLRQFLDSALGSDDDITLFEYMKKNNRDSGPALIGIELTKKENFKPLLKRMDKLGIKYEIIDKNTSLYHFLV